MAWLSRHARLVLVLLISAAWIAGASAQSLRERFRQMSARAEEQGLKEPFKGIATSNGLQRDLYSVRSTGVSTEPVRHAATAFLASLSGDQRRRTLFAVDDEEWRKWMNPHFYVRQGVSFDEMTGPQRELAFALLRSGLSASGLQLTRDIMRLNHTLAELTNDNFEEYGEWLYHLTVMGEPSPTEPWGWQLDGHHAIVNYFVLGDQVVMTPFFAGSEPVIATSGKYKGTAILQKEQAQGLAMIRALDPMQQRKAIVMAAKTSNNNLAEAFRDNVVIDYSGIRASDLSSSQRDQLLALIATYVNNQSEGHARVRLEEVKRHLDATWFAWVGGTEPTSVFYYRIHSPVVLIEFDHQRPANLGQLAKDPSLPTQQHIHVVMRTPNGNDYGKDLLRQHYQQHPH